MQRTREGVCQYEAVMRTQIDEFTLGVLALEAVVNELLYPTVWPGSSQERLTSRPA